MQDQIDFEVPTALLSATDQSWIDGRKADGSARSMSHKNPTDDSSLGDTGIADSSMVDAAVAAARRCFENVWSKYPLAERKRLLLAFADEVGKHAADLTLLETLEVGRPISDAGALNQGAANLVRNYANMIDKVHGDLFSAEEHRLGVVWRRPRGVVAAIVPWNVPVMNVLLRVAPALAAGNTIVVKPSENSPRSAVLLAKLASNAGIPNGAFNVVLGPGAETGQALAAHPDVNLVTFTGSTKTGLEISRAAARTTLKPVLMECGGKSAQIMLEDAFDDPAIWRSIFFSGFWNSGQWCVAKTRLIVPRALERAALEGLQSVAQEWPVGNPRQTTTRLGPLANASQLARVQAYAASASRLGELVDLGCPRSTIDARGCFTFPSVATQLPRGNIVSREEIFGPLITLEGFDDIADAIELANDTQFGLSASIWTNKSDLGYKLARSIEAGGVSVYSSVEAAKQSAPELGTSRYFEPRKQSGYGVEGGIPGFLAYTSAQSVSFFN